MTRTLMRPRHHRRRFMATFAGAGLGSTLVPGVLWARVQDSGAQKVTLAMVNEALKLSGIEVGEDEKTGLVEAANRNLAGYEDLRKLHIPPDVSPPFHFSPVVARHDREQDEAAVPPERGAGGEASGEPRGRRVLAGAPSRASWCARGR